MVREFTELQGTMGGVYARKEGRPEAVWKAIYFHYLPHGVEADAPPTRVELGTAATTWAAVSLADKLDTIVGLFAAGEKPTGSRDPFGLRRAAQGVLKILTDMPPTRRVRVMALVDQAQTYYGDAPPASSDWRQAASEFLKERGVHVLEHRGFEPGEVKAVAAHWELPDVALQCVQAVSAFRNSPEFRALGVLFKRVKNITKGFDGLPGDFDQIMSRLHEPAERALAEEIKRRSGLIDHAIAGARYINVMNELVALGTPLDRFFTDVMVMVDEQEIREARLTLLVRLKKEVLKFADPSAVVQEDAQV
jgi:glycyl-tRNA synthetase beta chain